MKLKKLLFSVLATCLLTLPSYGQDFVTPEGEGPIPTTSFEPNSTDYEIINGNISEPLLKKYLKRCTNAWLIDVAPIGPYCGANYNNNQQWGYWKDFITYTHPKMINLGAGLVSW